ncbi:MAG: RluA family pseudouridine synthase [Vicinamibacterales bacterium]
MSTPPAAWHTVTLDRGDQGVRLDRVLLRHLSGRPGTSRTRIQAWIAAGDVLVNGRPAPRASWRVAASDEVRVRLHEVPPRLRPSAEALPLEILHEDDDLLAVNKAAGMVVHPSYKHAAGTLMNALLAHTPTPGLVHRLDKLTSGIVLVAKRRDVHAALQREMERRAVDKDYLAIVWGRPSPLRGTIDLALDRDPWDRRKVTVRDRGGVPSVTRYEVAGRMRGPAEGTLSLVKCRLITGRMHQIRVHLAARGWPIVGDPTYGAARPPRLADPALDERARAFPRQALHAWRVAFVHPGTGRRLAIEAPLPPDMAGLLDAAGLRVPAAPETPAQ